MIPLETNTYGYFALKTWMNIMVPRITRVNWKCFHILTGFILRLECFYGCLWQQQYAVMYAIMVNERGSSPRCKCFINIFRCPQTSLFTTSWHLCMHFMLWFCLEESSYFLSTTKWCNTQWTHAAYLQYIQWKMKTILSNFAICCCCNIIYILADSCV